MLSQWSALMVLVTLTFDLLTLKLVYGSHKRWGNLHSEFRHARPSGSRVIRYVRNGRTDGRTDKSNAYLPLPTGGGITRRRQHISKNKFGKKNLRVANTLARWQHKYTQYTLFVQCTLTYKHSLEGAAVKPVSHHKLRLTVIALVDTRTAS